MASGVGIAALFSLLPTLTASLTLVWACDAILVIKLLKHALQHGLKLEYILPLLCLEILYGLLQYLHLIVLVELSSPPSEI